MEIPFKFKVSEVPGAAKKSKIWIVVNLIGLILYMASNFILYKEYFSDGVVILDTNTCISLGLTCLPILLAMFFVNAAWLVLSLVRKSRPTVFVWFLVVMVWVGVLSFGNFIKGKDIYPQLEAEDDRLHRPIFIEEKINKVPFKRLPVKK